MQKQLANISEKLSEMLGKLKNIEEDTKTETEADTGTKIESTQE